MVGRSRGFWMAFYGDLQKLFPAELGDISLDVFYRAINKVERSLIRTNADEVTYCLHVIMRFDFELALLEGKLKVKDLPDAWRERFRADFGIVPETDSDGVLQDVHWYDGFVGGAFQCYALGNVMSAQFFEAALRAHPEITREISEGHLDTLRGLAHEEHLSPRSQALARRNRRTRHRSAAQRRSLHRVFEEEVRRAVQRVDASDILLIMNFNAVRIVPAAMCGALVSLAACGSPAEEGSGGPSNQPGNDSGSSGTSGSAQAAAVRARAAGRIRDRSSPRMRPPQ